VPGEWVTQPWFQETSGRGQHKERETRQAMANRVEEDVECGPLAQSPFGTAIS